MALADCSKSALASEDWACAGTVKLGKTNTMTRERTLKSPLLIGTPQRWLKKFRTDGNYTQELVFARGNSLLGVTAKRERKSRGPIRPRLRLWSAAPGRKGLLLLLPSCPLMC